MMRCMVKSKISYARVTGAELYYQGSITIDEAVMEKADILPGEKVQVVNLNNGSRLETYVIKGEKNSGTICLNGPAARLGVKGDVIFILSYGLFDREELKKHKVRFVELDENNAVKNSHVA